MTGVFNSSTVRQSARGMSRFRWSLETLSSNSARISPESAARGGPDFVDRCRMRLLLLAGFAPVIALTLAGSGLRAQSSDPRAEVERVLQSMSFTAQDLATLQNSGVITRA